MALVSCSKNVEFNNPAMQSRINNTFWKASNMSAAVSESGALTITGYSGVGSLKLTTASVSRGTYLLGTTNQSSYVSYTALEGFEYSTAITQGPANKILLSTGGTGYETAISVPTTAISGSGSGLKVGITVNASGVITEVKVNAPGNGYKAGDWVIINAGNENAKIVIQDVTKSYGEIKIDENDGVTVSGSFKFVAYDSENAGKAVWRDGLFYKVPIK